MEQLFQILLLTVEILILLVMSVVGYFVRPLVQQVRENTRFRRYVAGDENWEDDEGKIGAYDQMHEKLKRDHKEVRGMLLDLRQRVNRLLRALDDAEDVDLSIPEEHDDDPDFRITDD